MNAEDHRRQAVLTKAVLNASTALGLSQEQLSTALHGNASSLDADGKATPGPSAERSLQIIQIYQLLYALVGGDGQAMRHWMRTHNRHFDGAPICVMQKESGLDQIALYLGAMQSR
jgi:hypothetical protein